MTEEEALRRRIGQLLIFGFEGQIVPDHIVDLIRDQYLGNIILFSRNVGTPEKLAGLNAALQTLAREHGQDLPLTVSADQENGVVRRLPLSVPGLPGNMALGAIGDPQQARRSGEMTGQLLRSLGINFNLAPVLDVNNNPKNPVIGVRSFGDQAEAVARLGAAFAVGLQARGVIACGKHFPGHGDTSVDSHLDLPAIPHTRERLDTVELLPFKAAIEAGIDCIMTAHVVFPAMEPDRIPATLSKRVLTGLLRDDLNFRGVLTTDCLEMNAISETVGVGRGAVESLKAGADMVMVSHRLDRQVAAVNAIWEAVRQGELSENRINEAYERVARLKKERLQDAAPGPDWPELIRQADALSKDLSTAAVTRLTAAKQPLPQNPQRVLVLVDDSAPMMVAAGRTGPESLLEETLARMLPGAQVTPLHFPAGLQNQSADQVLEQAAAADVVMAGVNGDRNPAYLEILERMADQPIPQATVLLRSPYDATRVPAAPNLIACYENTPWMVEAAVQAAFGGRAGGALPVDVSEAFPRGHRA